MILGVVHRQCGALPFRISASGGLEVLLVTSRGTKRWILPKGWPINGLSDPDSAAREAYEEAGVQGEIGEESIGSFTYQKQDDNSAEPGYFCVDVYPLQVERELTLWPEAHQRQKAWVSQIQAAQMIENIELRQLVEGFQESRR